jgi:hypothetical protein
MRFISDQEATERLEQIFPRFEWFGIPDYMRGAVARYFLWGIPGGSFLDSVLRNDLIGAVGRADANNSLRIREYVYLLTNSLPSVAIRDNVDDWISKGGWLGREDLEKKVDDAVHQDVR